MRGAFREPSPRWTVLAVALAVQTATSIVAAAMPVLLPFVKDAFRLTFAEAGLVANFSFVGGFRTIALAGLGVDSLGDRFVLVLGGVLAGVFAMAAGLVPSFWLLLPLLALLGLGIAMPPPAWSGCVRNAVPPRPDPRLSTGWPLGFHRVFPNRRSPQVGRTRWRITRLSFRSGLARERVGVGRAATGYPWCRGTRRR